MLPTFLTGIFIYLSYLGNGAKPRTFFQALQGNLMFFPIVFSLMWIGIKMCSSCFVLNFIGALSGIALAIVLSLSHISLIHLFFEESFKKRVFPVVMAYILMLCFGYIVGILSAEQLVKGKGDTYKISFLFKGYYPLNGQELILVTTDESSYCLVKQQNPVPKSPTLFIVPKSEISMATITRSR